MELTPEKILENYNKRLLNKTLAVEQLVSLIENSNYHSIRLESIKTLGEIGVKSDYIYKLLENLLISDSSESVRNAAAQVLRSIFIDKALEPFKWALQHDDSPFCLNTIFESLIIIIKNLEKQDDQLSKSILIDEVKKIDEKEFKIGVETLCEKKPIESFKNNELAKILINLYAFFLLKKTFWRLKYKIKECKIVELDFIFKGLTKLPEAIKYLSFLKILILRYNQLVELPEWIGSLTSLEQLNLNVNNITDIPKSIGSLASLKELSLWKNELKSIPSSIGSLSSLKSLNIRLNLLNRLPDTIGEIKELKELNLHDNNLESIPETIGSLSSLEILNLSWNLLTTLPDSLKSLNSLKTLDLERNELLKIPNSIGSLNSLKTLNLCENNLKRIPDSIGNLNLLEYLNLARNELTILPESIGNLSSLKELYIGENHLIKIPKSLKNLESKGLKIFY